MHNAQRTATRVELPFLAYILSLPSQPGFVALNIARFYSWLTPSRGGTGHRARTTEQQLIQTWCSPRRSSTSPQSPVPFMTGLLSTGAISALAS
jgi:hypothetical protein